MEILYAFKSFVILSGLIGSAEFVESYQSQLTQRAVAYLNVDLIFGNGTL